MKVFNQLCVVLALALAMAIPGANRAFAATPYFGRAILVHDSLTFGSAVTVDSFDSSDTNASVNGTYSPALAQDAAVVAVATDTPVDIRNVKIAGYVSTVSPSLTIGIAGSVGDRSWLEAGSHGIQPEHHLITSPIYMPPVQLPFTNGASPVSNVIITTTNGVETYDYAFDSGLYETSTLSGKISVRGHARVLVTSSIAITGTGKIEIMDGSRMEIYCAGESTTIGGNGVINRTGLARNFLYFGLPSNTQLLVSGEAGLIGGIYAPQADITISGGGLSMPVLVGSFVSKTLYVNARGSFHYDKALGISGPGWENPLLLLSLTTDGTAGTMRVTGPPGESYTLQFQENVSGTNWQDLQGGSLDEAGADEFFIHSTAQTRFYRVRLP